MSPVRTLMACGAVVTAIIAAITVEPWAMACAAALALGALGGRE